MEKEKKIKVIEFLSNRGFSTEQIKLVIRLIDDSRAKLIEEIISALHKKKYKIDNG